MKKTIFIAFYFLASITGQAQSWEATNLTQYNYLAISDMENHNGSLYALVFSGFASTLYRMDAGQSSWTTQTIQGVSETPRFLKSAGSKLYLGANGLGFGKLYVSADNGASFTPDIDGLPTFLSGIASIYGIEYFDGKVVANLGSNGYWIKDTTETTWTQTDTPTALNGGTDPICYSNGNLFVYDNAGAYSLYVSDNFGATWQKMTTNLPANFSVHLLTANSVNGRLYLAGGKVDGAQYGLYYSDDQGSTWTKADLSTFIGTNAQGAQQKIRAVFAKGDEIYIALENDTAKTTPDVLSSLTGIGNLKEDTLGLLVDPAGSIHGASFTEFDGKIALALNVRDVYLKSSTATSLSDLLKTDSAVIFPNPVKNKFTIALKNQPQNCMATITDFNGKQILKKKIMGRMDISSLHKGVYILTVQKEKGAIISCQKLIKQ